MTWTKRQCYNATLVCATATALLMGVSVGWADDGGHGVPAPVTSPVKDNGGVAKLLAPSDSGKWLNDSKSAVKLRKELNVR